MKLIDRLLIVSSKQVIGALCLLLYLMTAVAHQHKESYTTILFNERTGMMEVSQRFYLHDAEHALLMTGGIKGDILKDKAAQQAFVSYIQQSFSLWTEDGQPIVLDYVGFEIEGKYIWIYQETKIRPELKRLKVSMSSLQDVWPDQVNHINVEKNGRVRSVRLTLNDDWKALDLSEL
jgi:hypothetical protein